MQSLKISPLTGRESCSPARTYSLRTGAREATREGGTGQAGQTPLAVHTLPNNKPTIVVQKWLDSVTLTRRSKGILSPEVQTKSQVCHQPENSGSILWSPEGDSLAHLWDIHTHPVLWINLGLEGGMVKFTDMNCYT